MGIAERKAREKEQLRERIVAAAQAMFVQKGYESVSIRKIADAIEYSPATIYLHFRNKGELLYEVQNQAFQKFFAYLASVAEIEDPLQQLQEIGNRYLQFAMNNPELYDLMFIIQAPMNAIMELEEEWDCGYQAFDLLTNIVQRCQAAGYFRGEHPHAVALHHWSLMHGMVSLYLRDRMSMLPRSEVLPLIHQVMTTHFRKLSQ